MEENKNFCTVCGAELNDDGFCPSCDQAPDELYIPTVSDEAADVKAPTVAMPRIQDYEDGTEDTDSFPENLTPPELFEPDIKTLGDGTAEIVYNERIVRENRFERSPQRGIEPSGFALTITQAMRVIQYFFSKNVLDAVTAQYREKLPIWIILTSVSSLVTALSMTLSYSLTDGRSLGAGNVFMSFDMNGVETFFVALALSIGTLVTYSEALKYYLRAIGVETKFRSCANLVTAAYIPVVMGYVANIVSFGHLYAAGFDSGELGFAFFAIMLFIGVRRITKGTKPLWSFMLMLLIAAVVSIIIGLIVASPIIVTRGLMSMAATAVA